MSLLNRGERKNVFSVRMAFADISSLSVNGEGEEEKVGDIGAGY
jgi:hypothetical protein